MPKVGGRNFAYTEKGKKAAKTYAKKMNKPMMAKKDMGGVKGFFARMMKKK